MFRLGADRYRASVAAMCVIAGLAAPGAARAGVITDSPTLPLLGIPYGSPTGAGCFVAVGVCVTPGTLTQTALVSSQFNLSGQDIVTDATFTATLTTLANAPLGSITLNGTVEQEVLGRTTSTETGSWTTDLAAVSLSGPVLGHTLTVMLDPSNTSNGITSIEPYAGDGTPKFEIDSFFDVFLDLSLDSTPPLNTSIGPIFVVAGVPEPASLSLLALPMLALLLARAYRWRWTSPGAASLKRRTIASLSSVQM